MNQTRVGGVQCPMHTTILETIEASLEAQLAAVRARREKHSAAALRPKRKRHKPHLDLVEEVLRRAGEPLHVKEILHRVKILFDRDLERDSLVSAISKQIIHHERFIRTAPNTFALLVPPASEGPGRVTD